MTFGAIGAGISVASVNDVVAVLAVKSGHASAFVIPIGQRSATGAILARIIMAQVALGQDLGVDGGVAPEVARRAGQEELVLQPGGLGALGDPWLDVVGLDPLGEPAHVAVAVERIRSNGQVRDGGLVVEGALGYEADLVPMKAEDPQVLEARERPLLDALELVVAHDEGGQPGQVGEDLGRQHGYFVVAQVPK